MGDKPALSLVEKPKRLSPANNLTKCCGTSHPDHHVEEEAWWINSGDHRNCFWLFLLDKSDIDGVMKELVQSELAALFGYSNTKMHFMLKQAVTELTEALKLQGAIELLEDLDADELRHLVLPDDFEFVSEESSE